MNDKSALALGFLLLLGLAGVAAIAIVVGRRQGTTALPAYTQADLPVAGVVENELAEAEIVRYENTERIELHDIDPDLLMPRLIIIKRNSKELK